MPYYSSLHSPPPYTTNEKIDIRGRRRPSMRPMSITNMLQAPFALTTISISVVAWVLASVGSAISSAQVAGNPYPNYCWLSVAFMFCLIVGIFVVVASDTSQNYHIAIVGFLAPGFILTSSSVNSLISTSNIAKDIAAAGFTVLSILNIVWIFYFSVPSR